VAAGSVGSSDTRQPEMANPNGNAALRGDVSLNTIAWDYAPWLQTFGRHLMHRWIPPPAYSMGILKEGGWVVMEAEISKSGKMLRLEVLEEQGHPALSQAAQNALGSLTPIEPLPADFPEPTLILRIRMIYPKIRPRW
jgi:outer membrane biosynthesis protein TonB